MTTLDSPLPTEEVPKKREKIISALCPQCKKEFQKTRALRYFGKCSQMKDFVRRYESLQLLGGQLLLKKQSPSFTPEDNEELEKVNKLLNYPDAVKRYAQVLERRNRLAAKKKSSVDGEAADKSSKAKKKTIRERANPDEELVVPPPSKDFDDEMDIDGTDSGGEEGTPKSLLDL